MRKVRWGPPETDWADIPLLFDMGYLVNLFRVSRQTIFNYRKNYGLPVIVVGETVLIDKEKFRAWLDKMTKTEGGEDSDGEVLDVS